MRCLPPYSQPPLLLLLLFLLRELLFIPRVLLLLLLFSPGSGLEREGGASRKGRKDYEFGMHLRRKERGKNIPLLFSPFFLPYSVFI